VAGICGGDITSDEFGVNMIQQRTTLSLPLYVSYVYTTPDSGFTALNQVVSARFDMIYDTVLTNTGQAIIVEGGEYGATASMTSVGLNADMNLEIKFNTEFSSRGGLKAQEGVSEGPDDAAVVLSADGGRRREAKQSWSLTTVNPKSDFSGDYKAKFTPCVVPVGEADSAPCEDKQDQVIVITLPVAFVQADQPTPLEYTLESEFYLMYDLDAALTRRDASWDAFLTKAEIAHSDYYSADDTVFGRVSPTNPLSGIRVNINRAMLCAKNPNTNRDFEYNPGKTGSPLGCLDSELAVESLTLVLNGNAVGNTEIVSGSMLQGPEDNFDVQVKEQICAGENRDCGNIASDDIFSFNAKPLVAGSSYRWYTQVEYSVAA
jgi:hypothetical protein